jgi:hypothetical protein
MKKNRVKNRGQRVFCVVLVVLLTLGGVMVVNPLGIIKIQGNVSAASMTVFYEDFDSSTGTLPWTGSSGTWTDNVNNPSSYGISNWQVVTDPTAPTSPNALYSGPEQQGYYEPPPVYFYWGTCTNAETPSIDLRNASAATLTFMHRYNFPGTPLLGTDGGTAVGYGDGGMIFISTDYGVTWDYLEPEEEYPGYVGGQPTWETDVVWGVRGGMNPYEPFGDHDELFFIGGFPIVLISDQGGGAYVDDSGGWIPATFDLTKYVGSEVIISFRYTQNWEDQGGTDTWWLIDNVKVDKETIDGPGIKVIGSDTQIIEQGQTYSYVLNITNWKGVADWIELNFFTTLGWTVELLDYTTYVPLTDDGGIAGLVDIGWLGSNSWLWIRVNITVPAGEGWDIQDISYITATSFLDPTKSSSEELFTSTPNPDVGVSQVYIPSERPPNLPIEIEAIIMNYGTYTASFQVQCKVEGDLLVQPTVYNSTGDPSEYNWIYNLDPGNWVLINWSFTPTLESSYDVEITTLLSIDQYEPNNSTSGVIFVQVLDWEDHMDDTSTGWPGLGPSDAQDGLWEPWDNGVGTQWELGSPILVGPINALDGAECWGTNITADYTDNTAVILHTPFFNFSTASSVTITFYQWYELTGGGPGEDFVYFGYNEDPATPGSLSIISSYSGDSMSHPDSDPVGWIPVTLEVSSVAAGNPNIRFSWMLEENGNFQAAAGYYIDNVSIRASRPGAVLKITELVDNDGLGNEFIEVQNSGDTSAILSDYDVSIDGGVTWISGTWTDDTGDGLLGLNEFGYFSVNQIVNPDSFDDEGAAILLANTSSLPQGLIHDRVEYGQFGTVPDPITGESVARWWNGVIYSEDWAREITSSIGGPQIGNATIVNPLVVLNEVYFNPETGERFIELVYAGKTGDPDVDVTGWIIVVDGIPYTIPGGPWETNLNSIHNLYVINESMATSSGSEIFSQMNTTGDNVYVFNSTGSLVDMVGWSDPHIPGTAIARVPDGYGVTIGFETFAKDGFDDPSSIEAGWQFLQNHTMGIITIEKDQSDVGDLGDTITYVISLTNDAFGDTIDLYNTTFGEGWVVELFGPNGIIKLIDTNANGIPDTGVLGPLAPNQVINITVKVTIPTQKAGNFMDIEITAVPQDNPQGSDIVTLRTETYPHVEVDKYASPTEIWVNGSAPSYIPKETTMTLKVWGAGLEQFLQFPQDVVFVIDKSGSMSSNDPDPDGGGPRRPARVEAAWNYVDNMSLPDRAAVVKFSDNAILVDGPNDVPLFGDNEHTVWDLSSQYSDIKDNIDECGDATGGTALGFALEIAVDQLIANGNSSHIQVIIALTDGETWDATRAYEQAKRAADNGIRIYTIGLGNGLFLTGLPIWFLEHFIANTTGGRYYPAATPDALFGIYAQIGQEINEIAGKQIQVGLEKYLIRDILMPGINFIPGSFTIPPDNITVNATGHTWLQWEKLFITINETWTCTFRIRSNNPGFVETNDYEFSRVKYTNWNNMTITENFPGVNITVKSPMPDPPLLRIFYDGTTVVLDWTPPSSQIVDYYLIYRSTARDDFGDFSNPWINTSSDIDPLGPGFPIGDRISWNDTTASASSEYYYIIRAVNTDSEISSTSNTVGKYDRAFPLNVSTFSLPLEPSYDMNVSWYIEQIGSSPTDYIKFSNPATQTWVTHFLSDGNGVNDTVMRVGEGYEIKLASSTTYTFSGEPGSSIRFLEGEMPQPDNFQVSVIGTNVFLSWDQVPGADHYIVYRATSRDGLNNRLLPFAGETVNFGANAYIDLDPQVNIGGEEFYYAVGAVNSSSMHTSLNTTYAIGVWIGNYSGGYNAFGLPLQTFDSLTKTVDEYCDDIPNTVGINYYIDSEQRWGWHRFNMPQNAYDEVLGYTKGYQLSTFASTNYYYVGR